MSSVQCSTYQPVYLAPKVFRMIKLDWGKFKQK